MADQQFSYQMNRQYPSEVKQIVIDNFSGGLIEDVDDTSEGNNGIINSLSNVINMDINTIIGGLQKREGIHYDTSRFGALPDIPAGYTLGKVYEFQGADNNLIQLVSYFSGNTWKIYYRVAVLSDEKWTGSYSLLQPAPNDFYILNSGEEPVFDAYNGSCRIGLGINNDPLILFYNRNDKFFASKPYLNESTGIGVEAAEISSLVTGIEKEWVALRAVPIPDISVSVATNKISNQMPSATLVFEPAGIYEILKQLKDKNSTTEGGTSHDLYTLNISFWECSENLEKLVTFPEWWGRFYYPTFILNPNKSTNYYTNGYTEIGVSSALNVVGINAFSMEIIRLFEKAINEDTREFYYITTSAGVKKKINDIFKCTGILSNSSNSGMPMIRISYKMVSIGGTYPGTDFATSNTFNTKKQFYFPPSDSVMVTVTKYEDNRHTILNKWPEASKRNFGVTRGRSDDYNLSSVPGVNLDLLYTGDNSWFANASDRLHKGDYEFKVTMMFNNQETVPITITNSKVKIEAEYEKIALRITVNTLNDYRFNKTNVYVKRTIPKTTLMTSEERNEAAEYTDIDYRLVRQIDMIKSVQELHDVLRQNAKYNTAPKPATGNYGVADYYGGYTVAENGDYTSGPMIWMLVNNKPTIDFIYSDLVSGSGMEQSTGQETTLGSMAMRLSRDEKDEGIIKYNGSCYYRGRRYFYGAKKLQADGSEIQYSDRIYYSLITPNLEQLDIVSDDSYINVKESESVIHVTTFRDFLFVLTNLNAYRIDLNIESNQVEDIIVTDTFLGQGCTFKKSVVSIGAMLVWANQHGIWAFDGQKPINLVIGKWLNTYQKMIDSPRPEFIGTRRIDTANIQAVYCPYNSTIWFYIVGSGINGITFYVFSLLNNCWWKYRLGFEKEEHEYYITSMYLGLDNNVYVLYHGDKQGIAKYPKKGVYTDNFHGNIVNYTSLIKTQALFDGGEFDKQPQNHIIIHKNYNSEVWLSHSLNDESTVVGTSIKLKPANYYVADNIPAPFMLSQNLKLTINSTSDSLLVIKKIITYYTEVELAGDML